jgi:HSP20 family protein
MFARKMLDFPGIGWTNPLAEMERMRRQMETLSDLVFRGAPSRLYAASGVFPSLNLTEDAERYLVRAELPGLKADELDIQVVGKSLTVSGERRIPSEGESVRYHRREREAGRFSRVIGLPGDIDPGKVEAKMENGLLTVVLPKAEAAKPRQISVK